MQTNLRGQYPCEKGAKKKDDTIFCWWITLSYSSFLQYPQSIVHIVMKILPVPYLAIPIILTSINTWYNVWCLQSLQRLYIGVECWNFLILLFCPTTMFGLYMYKYHSVIPNCVINHEWFYFVTTFSHMVS